MILRKQPTLEGVSPPLRGKRFLQHNEYRAAKNTACYPFKGISSVLNGDRSNAMHES